MIVARTVEEARAALRGLPRPLGFVPTMGALHAGHLSLVTAAKQRCASVAASVFVNPTQFGRGEDFGAYPRDEARDLRLLEEAGVAVAFVPTADEMYPEGFATGVHVGGRLTKEFEGAERGGHFDGVAVIVTKLLAVVAPDVLFLGEKDAQQLAVVRRFVRDLDLPVAVAGVPTLREPDGLAMSSRNVYLSPEERAVAPALYAALRTGREAAAGPGATPADAVAAALGALDAAAGQAGPGAPRFAVDYVAVVDAGSFAPETALGPRSLLIAAARLGTTRLLDNLTLAATAGDPAPPPPAPGAYPPADATTRK